MSSAVHLITVERPGGGTDRAVLRRYVRHDPDEPDEPDAADVGHRRINLLTLGAGVAGRFTALWERASGATYHPWGDLVTIVGFLDDLRDDWGAERFLVEDMLARAVADLSG